MDVVDSNLLAHESRLVRRLERLFRLERRGILARRPRDVAGHLLGRRADLVTALTRADAMRRALGLPISPDLQTAAESLWREVGRARGVVDARLRQLEADLRVARGETGGSGARDSVGGRLIGKG